MKIECLLDGKEVECKVTENLGFQGDRFTKAVEYNGEERIVQKYGEIWMPRTEAEKLGLRGRKINDNLL